MSTERRRASWRAYAEQNKEKRKEYMREYGKQNRERLNARNRERYAASSARRQRRLAANAAWNAANGSWVEQYEQSYHRACLNAYKSLRRRCRGEMLRGAHIYCGLPYCTQEEFIAWAQIPENVEAWTVLRCRFEQTRLPRDRPSLDRINTAKTAGYVPRNLRWLSHGENCARGSRSQHADRRKHDTRPHV